MKATHVQFGDDRLPRRFWDKVEAQPDGCWVWIASTAGYRRGYGGYWDGSRFVRAHRHAFTVLAGRFDESLTLDHLCRNTLCVNPAHLEPVTGRVNTLRSDGVTARNARKTHCMRGHEFTDENTVRTPKGRSCRICTRESDRKSSTRRNTRVPCEVCGVEITKKNMAAHRRNVHTEGGKA